MAFDFKKAFNSQVDVANKLNKGLNEIIGKEVFGEVQKMEDPREYAPYESFSDYTALEPVDWPVIEGEKVEFMLEGSVISFPKALDTCIRYRKYFDEAAEYYAARFEFKYGQCVEDFDTLVHYFPDMYSEGLRAMCRRAYSLLLPMGVFSANLDEFEQKHMAVYHAAVDSFEAMAGIELQINAASENLGNQVGNSVQLQGGGFGLKGAVKGIAKAEAFNFGVEMLGKLVAQQTKMTKAQKSEVYNQFNKDRFFQEVLLDYKNTFYTLIQTLSENGILGSVTTLISDNAKTTLTNLQNPMFPKDKLAEVFAQLISTNPFYLETFNVLKGRFGMTDEVQVLVNYFSV